MYLRMARRLLTETDKRSLWKLTWNMGFKGMRAIGKHKRRLKRGEFYPPFLYISVINSSFNGLLDFPMLFRDRVDALRSDPPNTINKLATP